MGIITALLGTTAACDSKTSSGSYQEKQAEEQRIARQADAALAAADIAQAAAEFKRRLRDRVVMQDGVLLVKEVFSPKASTVLGFPAPAPWSITCGTVGLTVTFGAGTSEQGGIVDVDLSQAALNDEQCRQVIPSLARELIAVNGSRNAGGVRLDQ